MPHTIEIEELGGGPGVDNVPAIVAYQELLRNEGKQVELVIGPGSHRFDSTPPAFTNEYSGVAPVIVGFHRMTQMVKNYYGANLFRIAGLSAYDFRCMRFRAGGGKDGGMLLNIEATETIGANDGVLEDLIFDSTEGGYCSIGLRVNGQAKVTGAIGIRSLSMRNVQVFVNDPPNGIVDRIAVDIRGVAGLSWLGGGVVSGDMVIVGSDLFRPLYIDMALEQIGGTLSLSHCEDVEVRARTIVRVGNDGYCRHCWVRGRVVSYTENWDQATCGIIQC